MLVPNHLHRGVCTGEVTDLNRPSRSVVDNDHPKTVQRRDQATQSEVVVAHGDHHGDIALVGVTRRTRVGDGCIQECAGQLCADIVAHLQSPGRHHRPRRRREPQQPHRRPAQESRAGFESGDTSIELNRETIR